MSLFFLYFVIDVVFNDNQLVLFSLCRLIKWRPTTGRKVKAPGWVGVMRSWASTAVVSSGFLRRASQLAQFKNRTCKI